MRAIIAGFFILVCAVSSFLVYEYNKKASTARDSLNQERYLRMVAEENVEKSNSRISSLESELARSQKKIKTVEKLVEQTQVVNKNLESQLDKVLELKGSLESKIKELEQVTVTEPALIVPGT